MGGSLAVILTVNPSDHSCSVQKDLDNQMFLLNRKKLVRDPAFADDEVMYGGLVGGTPEGDVTSPRSAVNRDSSQGVNPGPEHAGAYVS